MKDMMEAFKKYAKEQFGYDISFEKSSTPDTFGSLFGMSFINQKDEEIFLPEGHQENVSYSNNIAKVNCVEISCDEVIDLQQDIAVAA